MIILVIDQSALHVGCCVWWCYVWPVHGRLCKYDRKSNLCKGQTSHEEENALMASLLGDGSIFLHHPHCFPRNWVTENQQHVSLHQVDVYLNI